MRTFEEFLVEKAELDDSLLDEGYIKRLFGILSPEEAYEELVNYLTNVAKIMNRFSPPRYNDVMDVLATKPQFSKWKPELKQEVINLFKSKVGFANEEDEINRSAMGDVAQSGWVSPSGRRSRYSSKPFGKD